jgi:hypothetical protein
LSKRKQTNPATTAQTTDLRFIGQLAPKSVPHGANSMAHASTALRHEGAIPSRIHSAPVSVLPSAGNGGRPGAGFNSRSV